VRRRDFDVALNVTKASTGPTAPEFWAPDTLTADVTFRGRWQTGSVSNSYWFVAPRALAGAARAGAYGKAELALGRVQNIGERGRFALRAYGGAVASPEALPGQRALFLSTEDPVITYGNHWWRPLGGILKRTNVNWLPLGGPGLRGVHWSAAADWAAGANAELSSKLLELGSEPDTLGVWLTAFADGATLDGKDFLMDVGPGIAFRGNLYDLPVNLRLDFPLWLSDPSYDIATNRNNGKFGLRWTITFNDLW
jgi:hypothetical protein